MAQTGYTPVLLYGSTTTGNTPSAANLTTSASGVELAINAFDGRLFYKDNAGVVQVLATKGTAAIGGSNTQVQYNSSGTLAGSANFTFNGTTVTMANDASINGLTVGRGAGAVSTNTAVGASALAANTSGGQNVAVGASALYSNTTGVNNSVVGRNALYYNTTGQNNVAFGAEVLINNTTGFDNTVVGYQAASGNTTAANNVAVGSKALYYNNASDNTAVGFQTAFNNTTGASNVAVGRQALYSNTTASNNTAVGYQAGYSNTTGARNTYVGYRAGYSITTSDGITAIGHEAGLNTTGGFNVFLGRISGQAVTTGLQNTFLGDQSGYLVTTGSKNTIIGGYSGNQGGLDIRTASNYVVLSDGDGNPRGIFDSSGNLGIGVTPSAWSGQNAIQFNYGAFSAGTAIGTLMATNSFYNGTNWIYRISSTAMRYTQDSAGHYWHTAPSGTAGTAITFTQAMTLDASGNLGVGTTSPNSRLDVSGTSPVISVTPGAQNQTTAIDLRVLNSGTYGAARIAATNASTYDSNLLFYTNTSSSTTLVERARIDSSGRLLLGTTSASIGAVNCAVALDATTVNSGYGMGINGNASNTQVMRFAYAGTAVGSIAITSSTTIYNTISDYRLKDNQQPLTGSGEFIDALQPKTWEWKADGSKGVGFIAHEVQEVSPGSVIGAKDAVDEEGNPLMQAMEYGSAEFIANIIAELQSLRKRVAQLEAK